MGTYSISDLAELTGVKTHTLRVWERRYGLLRPQRTDTNIRYYEDKDLKRLKMVQKLNIHGIKISRIAEMSMEEIERESDRISVLHQDHEEKLNRGLISLDVNLMDAVLDESIREHGFEATLRNLILPTLEKMELLWLSGTIEAAHEACFQELIKRKTIREIDIMPHNCAGPRLIMFLPQGNQQELSHLFMHFFLRKEGLCVTDMGTGISLDCACSAMTKCSCDSVLIVNADPVHWQFGAFIKDLSDRTHIPIIISGRASENEWAVGNEKIIVLDAIDETVRFVSHLHENLRNHIS
ncbi:MAG: MerR family transcriptional regulator [Saprospiraceae bacterium]